MSDLTYYEAGYIDNGYFEKIVVSDPITLSSAFTPSMSVDIADTTGYYIPDYIEEGYYTLPITEAEASISSAFTTSATATRIQQGAVDLTAQGTLSGSISGTKRFTAAFGALFTPIMNVKAYKNIAAEANSEFAISIDAVKTTDVESTQSVTCEIVIAFGNVQQGEADLSVQASQSATAGAIRPTSASMSGAFSPSMTAVVTRRGDIDISVSSNVSIETSNTLRDEATLENIVNLSLQGARVRYADSAQSSTATLNGTGIAIRDATSTQTTQANLSAIISHIEGADIVVTPFASLTIEAINLQGFVVQLESNASVNANAGTIYSVDASLSSEFASSTAALNVQLAEADLDVVSSVYANPISYTLENRGIEFVGLNDEFIDPNHYTSNLSYRVDGDSVVDNTLEITVVSPFNGRLAGITSNSDISHLSVPDSGYAGGSGVTTAADWRFRFKFYAPSGIGTAYSTGIFFGDEYTGSSGGNDEYLWFKLSGTNTLWIQHKTENGIRYTTTETLTGVNWTQDWVEIDFGFKYYSSGSRRVSLGVNGATPSWTFWQVSSNGSYLTEFYDSIDFSNYTTLQILRYYETAKPVYYDDVEVLIGSYAYSTSEADRIKYARKMYLPFTGNYFDVLSLAHDGAADLTATTTQAATIGIIADANANLSSAFTQTAQGYRTTETVLTAFANGSITADAVKTTDIDTTMSSEFAQSNVDIILSKEFDADIAASATQSTDAVKNVSVETDFDSIATQISIINKIGAVFIDSDSEFTASITAVKTTDVDSAMSSAFSQTADGIKAVDGGASASSTTTTSTDGNRIRFGVIDATANTTASTTGNYTVDNTATLSSAATIEATATGYIGAGADLTSSATLTLNGSKTTGFDVLLNQAATLVCLEAVFRDFEVDANSTVILATNVNRIRPFSVDLDAFYAQISVAAKIADFFVNADNIFTQNATAVKTTSALIDLNVASAITIPGEKLHSTAASLQASEAILVCEGFAGKVGEAYVDVAATQTATANYDAEASANITATITSECDVSVIRATASLQISFGTLTLNNISVIRGIESDITARARQDVAAKKIASGTASIDSAMSYTLTARTLRLDSISYTIPSETRTYSISGETGEYTINGETRIHIL